MALLLLCFAGIGVTVGVTLATSDGVAVAGVIAFSELLIIILLFKT